MRDSRELLTRSTWPKAVLRLPRSALTCRVPSGPTQLCPSLHPVSASVLKMSSAGQTVLAQPCLPGELVLLTPERACSLHAGTPLRPLQPAHAWNISCCSTRGLMQMWDVPKLCMAGVDCRWPQARCCQPALAH